MSAKLDKVDVSSKVPPSIEHFNALITWSSDHVTDEKRYIWPSARTVTNKLDKVVGFIAGLLFTTSLNLFITWSHKVIWQLKNVIIHFHVTFDYKNRQKGGLWLGVTYPTTKSHIPSITWLLKITWQMKLVIYFLPWGLLLLSLAGWWLVKRSHHTQSNMILWSRDLV